MCVNKDERNRIVDAVIYGDDESDFITITVKKLVNEDEFNKIVNEFYDEEYFLENFQYQVFRDLNNELGLYPEALIDSDGFKDPFKWLTACGEDLIFKSYIKAYHTSEGVFYEFNNPDILEANLVVLDLIRNCKYNSKEENEKIDELIRRMKLNEGHEDYKEPINFFYFL